MSEIYVVGVSHNTPEGEVVGDTVLLTKDILKALRIARTIDDLGYKCFTFDTGATIRRLSLNHPYRKIDPKFLVGKRLPRKYVFARRHAANHAPRECAAFHWEETWFDVELQRLMNDGAPLN